MENSLLAILDEIWLKTLYYRQTIFRATLKIDKNSIFAHINGNIETEASS